MTRSLSFSTRIEKYEFSHKVTYYVTVAFYSLTCMTKSNSFSGAAFMSGSSRIWSNKSELNNSESSITISSVEYLEPCNTRPLQETREQQGVILIVQKSIFTSEETQGWLPSTIRALTDGKAIARRVLVDTSQKWRTHWR